MTKQEKAKINNLYSFITNKLDEKNYKINVMLFENEINYNLLHKEINSVILLNNIKKEINKLF